MCGGSFMSGIAPQIGQTAQTALGGGANPLQSIGTGGGGGGFFGGAIGGIAPQIGGGLMGGGMPAPMQNPFLGGQGMSAAQMNPQQYRAAPVQNIDSVRQALGIPNDPGLTPYKLGQTLGGSSGGGTGQPIKFFDGDYSLGDLRDRMAAGRADTTNVFPPQVSRPLTDVPQYGGGTPFTLPPQVSRPPESFHPGVPVSQGPGAGIPPEILQKLLQGTPSDANGPYPALVSALPYGGGMGQPQPQVFPAQPRPQVLPKEKPQIQQPTRSINPIAQRMAQKIQNQNQKQGLAAGIGSLINRGMMF